MLPRVRRLLDSHIDVVKDCHLGATNAIRRRLAQAKGYFFPFFLDFSLGALSTSSMSAIAAPSPFLGPSLNIRV